MGAVQRHGFHLQFVVRVRFVGFNRSRRYRPHHPRSPGWSLADENGDGQVTFAAVPPGAYTVQQTRTPSGYPTINDYDIVVQNRFGVPLGFIVKQATAQNSPNTRNVSVAFVDSRTNT